MSKSVYVRVFNELRIIERCSSVCDRMTALISRIVVVVVVVVFTVCI